MKTQLKSIIFVILLFAGGCTYSCETNKVTDQPQNQKGSYSLKKMSADLYEAYNNNKNKNEKIDVIVKTVTPITDEQVRELKRACINVQTISGTIFTANLPLKSIPVLVKKPYVVNVELSRKLKLLNQ
ncbi:MAG: hypothetical protein ACP5JP_03380 [bacterium]